MAEPFRHATANPRFLEPKCDVMAVSKPSVLMLTLDAPHIDRRILQESVGLAQNGHTVTVLSPSPAPEGWARPGLSFANVRERRGYASSLTWLTAAKRALNTVPSLKRLAIRLWGVASPSTAFLTRDIHALGRQIPADIVMAHDLPMLRVAGRLASERRGKLVYDAHEFYLGQRFLSRTEVKELSEDEREFIGQSSLNITVNEDIARLFSATYGVDEPLVVHNGCGQYVPRPGVATLRQRLGLGPARPIVLFQGAFHADRNLPEVVRLAACLDPDICVVMLGWGGLKADLRRDARRLGLEGDRLFLLDKVSQHELLDVTASADFGLIPYPAVDTNTTYCSPNKLFEFMEAGLPILYNEDLVTVGHILGRAGCGVPLPLGDLNAAAATINALARDRTAIARLRSNARESCVAYRWEAQERKLLEAFERIS